MPIAEPIDTQYLGKRQQICCWKLGDILVDPGPTPGLGKVVEAVGDDPIRRILITHIHLDHSGGAGVLLRDHYPDAEIWVSERGSRHLIDPTRLIASAEQVYGGADQLAALFGEIAPVPEASVRIVREGDVIDGFRVAETQGHAKHHVSYFHEASGDAYVGDTASVRLPGHDFVLPMTTPPDVDLEAWDASLDKIAAWQPKRLMLTHFGAFDDVDAHIARARHGLVAFAQIARHASAEQYGEALSAALASGTGIEDPTDYGTTMHAETLWQGLQIYWDRVGR
jgi:glyoxylase-like metal-dependent hydrolase (beta-lactamase superfamily II)